MDESLSIPPDPNSPETESRKQRERKVEAYANQERLVFSENEPHVGSLITCGDGRTNVKREKKEVLASFGEHISDARALFIAANKSGIPLSPTEAVTTIREIVEKAGGIFSGHSDEDVEGQLNTIGGLCIGCADTNLPTIKENAAKYDLTDVQARELIKASRDILAQNGGFTIFKGIHKELDLLIIVGDKATVPHSNETEQHFVYDLSRNSRRLKALHAELAARYPTLTWETFFNTYLKQLSATNDLLIKPRKIKYYAVNADIEGHASALEYDSLEELLSALPSAPKPKPLTA